MKIAPVALPFHPTLVADDVDSSDFTTEAVAARDSIDEALQGVALLLDEDTDASEIPEIVSDIDSFLSQADEAILDATTFSDGLDVDDELRSIRNGFDQARDSWLALDPTSSNDDARLAAAALEPLAEDISAQLGSVLDQFGI